MGAISYFEEQVIKDRSGQSEDISFQMGASNLDIGNKLGCIFIKIDGKEYFFDDETGEKLVKAFNDAGSYLGYNK